LKIGALLGILLELKKLLEVFYDFVFVFDSKIHEGLNIGES
jgi:hypothetical protein